MNNRTLYDEEVPPFPFAGLEEKHIGQHCLALSSALETPLEFTTTAALMAVSAAANGGLSVETISGLTTNSNLFSIQALPSGAGKTMVYEKLFQPHADFEANYQAAFRSDTLPQIEARLKLTERKIDKLSRPTDEGESHQLLEELSALYKEQKELKRKSLVPRFLAEDTTPESLEVLLADYGSIDLNSSDARKLIKNLAGEGRRGSRTEEDVLLKGFSGDRTKVDRISRDSVSSHQGGSLSMSLTVQNDLITKLYSNESLSESGLLGRILPLQFFPESAPSLTPFSGDLNHFQKCYADQLNPILHTYRTASPGTYVVKVPTDVKQVMDLHRQQVQKKMAVEDDVIVQCMARWSEIAWKLALVLQVICFGVEAHKHPLHIWCAQRAIQIVEWFGIQQRLCLENAVSQSVSSKLQSIEALLCDSASGHVSSRDVQRRMKINAAEVSRLVSLSDGRLELFELESSGGRPMKMLRLAVK